MLKRDEGNKPGKSSLSKKRGFQEFEPVLETDAQFFKRLRGLRARRLAEAGILSGVGEGEKK